MHTRLTPLARSLSVCRLATWLFVLLASVIRLRGEVTESITSLTITNYTGYVLASDTLFGLDGYNRDTIAVRSVVKYLRSTATSTYVFDYTYQYRLVDPNGVAQPLIIGLGTNTVASAVVVVNRTGPIILFPDVTHSMELKPAGQLDPYTQYRVELTLLRRPNGTLIRPTATGDEALTTPASYLHFPSVVATDTDVNVIPVIEGGGWTRTYLLNGGGSRSNLQAQVNFKVHRWDRWNISPLISSVDLSFRLELRDANTDAIIPLADDFFTSTRSLATYTTADPMVPSVANLVQTLSFSPTGQLDPINKLYKLKVTIGHYRTALSPFPDEGNSITSINQRLLHLNGKLFFGAIETRFDSIANNPVQGAISGGTMPTTLAVDGQNGFLSGHPGYTYGNGTALSVRVSSNGTATLSAGSVVLAGPTPDEEMIENVRMARGAVTLDTLGAQADLGVYHPAGFSYAFGTAGKLTVGLSVFQNIRLGQNLRPLADPEYPSFAGDVWAVDETKPVWMKMSAIKWLVNQGRFEWTPTGDVEYVRKTEYERLAASTATTGKVKPSNERYYQSVEKVLSPKVIVEANEKGAALLTVTFGFKAGGVIPHFPSSTIMSWTAGGKQAIDKDEVVPSKSFLPGAAVLSGYARDCQDIDCGTTAGPDSMLLKPVDDELRFTPDGGLHGIGSLSAPKTVAWGWIAEPSIQKYAHQTDPFTEGSFLMSGFFLRGDRATNTVIFLKPGTILFSGFTVSNQALTRVERPKGSGYATGFADYAGMNFRVGANGAKKAKSVIAGKPTGNYPLTGRSKYYVRMGGVNGIHEAVFGQFPETFVLYGYPVNFDNFGLSYLDTENKDSRTQGYLTVPGPSNFKQNFEELKFSCLGALESAKVPASEANVAKVLDYWTADFYTRAIQFDRKAADQCDPGKGVLTLGVDAFAVHVEGTLHGVWGFHPSGNLITLADCQAANGPLDPPFDSRLKMPGQFKLKGPKQEKYNVTPISDAYLSNWDYRGQNGRGVGFVNFAAKLDVPFFEDLKVHVHTSANREQTNAPIHMMGGWPTKGYQVAGKDFFNDKTFDSDNKGFPGDVNLIEYEDGKESLGDKYHVRAMRNWLDIVQLDAPLKWSSSGRAFRGYEQVKTDLVVISAEYEPKYLSAINAELTFGIQYEGMPQINLANLAFDQLGGLQDAFQGVVQAEVIDKGFNALNSLLEAGIQQVMEPVLNELLEQPINALFAELSSHYDPVQKQFTVPLAQVQNIVRQYCGVVAGAPTNFRNVLETGLLGEISNPNGIVGQIDGRLADAEGALLQIENLLAEAGDGNRQLVTTLLKQLVSTLVAQATDSPIAQSLAGMAADIAGGAIDPYLNEFLKKADPTLDEIHSVISSIRGVFTQVRGALGNGQEFVNELKAKMNELVAGNEVLNAMQKACQDVESYLGQFQAGIDNPFTPANAQAFKNHLRQRIGDRLGGSAIPAAITSILKQRLYDLESAVHEAVDSVFQQVNIIIRDTLGQALSEIDNSINGFLGPVSGTMGAGRINGYAHIVGDSLKELRLDIYAQFKVPTEMEFNAYVQIRELDSESEENGCIGPGEKATEVRVGAKDVDLSFASTDLVASVEAKFTFRTEPSFTIMGVGAGVEITGELSFATFKITYLGAQMAFGSEENYFSGACALEFNSYKAKGGIYFGRTCTLDPFFWDQDVKQIIGKPPFTGVYAYGEVWIPVSEALLGIPATCLFEISAGVGLGAGFFIEGPTFVGKMLLGCYGSILCLASLEGELKLVGVKNADGLQLKGGGRLEGCLGPCPFCVCADAQVDVTYKNGDWDVSF